MSGKRSRWHTKTVGIKALILYILLVATVVATALSLCGISDTVDELDKENPQNSEWHQLRLLFLAASFENMIMCGAIACAPGDTRTFKTDSDDSPFRSDNHRIKISGNCLGSTIMMFCVWLQCIALSVCIDTIYVTVGLLSLAIRGFCSAQIHRLSSLYNGCSIRDTGFFKFVMAASICTQFYYMDGVPSHHFWIVLSTCAALTFLSATYFRPSNAHDDHHNIESQSQSQPDPDPDPDPDPQSESKFLPLHHDQPSWPLYIILLMAEDLLSGLIYHPLPSINELSSPN